MLTGPVQLCLRKRFFPLPLPLPLPNDRASGSPRERERERERVLRQCLRFRYRTVTKEGVSDFSDVVSLYVA